MKIAVTGGMGFIGHELVDRLTGLGHEVTVVDYMSDLVPMYERAKLPIINEIYRILPKCVSVVDPWEFIAHFEKFGAQVVVHAGAVVNTKDLGSEEMFQKNVRYTELLTEACSNTGANLIFISSAATYGNDGFPNNPYGLTKALGEKIVEKSRAKTASLRLFNVFGTFEHHKGEMASVPWKIAQSFNTGVQFDLHSLDARRDFVPSTSVVSAIVNVADDMMGPGEKWHRVYDVGTGKPMSFRDLRTTVAKAVRSFGTCPVKMANIPPELIGRYQTYTCAGEHGAENIGGIMSTEDGIMGAYGGAT